MYKQRNITLGELYEDLLYVLKTDDLISLHIYDNSCHFHYICTVVDAHIVLNNFQDNIYSFTFYKITIVKKFITFLADHWKAISASIGAILAALAALLSLCSCGSTVKALVQSPKDSATTTITITTNNPTQVSPETTTNPNISVSDTSKSL